MDDYSMASLNESKNEWCIRLVNIMTGHIIDGFKSIFNEAWKICKDDDEMEKYLMTFQNLMSKIPQWNETIIETEKKRIIENSNCSYIEDLLTCVHIVQLKALTCVRVSSNQKKIDLDIPSLDKFIHKVYINIARKLYINIYLFERNIAPLEIQKRNREFEIIVKECIMNTIRDNIPVDDILRAYIDETEELNTEENEEIVKVQNIETNEEKEKIEKEEKKKQENLDKETELLEKENEIKEKKQEIDEKVDEVNTKIEKVLESGNKLVNETETIIKQDVIDNPKEEEDIPAPSIHIEKTAPAMSINDEEPQPTNKISFSPTTEAVSVDGIKSESALINEPTPSMNDMDDDDDGDSIKIGDTLNLDSLISEDLSEKPLSIDKPSLNIEVLT
tara:strand:- start:3679 stop:4848 length:1170 start_codon:yes stop_codon:yes gene_type:complete